MMSKQVKVNGRIISVPDDATTEQIGRLAKSFQTVEESTDIEPIEMSTGEKIATVAKSALGQLNPVPIVKGLGNFALESIKENPLFPLKPAAEKFTMSRIGQYDEFMNAMGANSDAGLTTKAAAALSTIPILGDMMVSGAKRVSLDEKTSLEGTGELIGDAALGMIPFGPKALTKTAHGAGKALQSSGVQSAVAAGTGYVAGGPFGGYLGYMLRRRLLAPPMRAAGEALENVNLQWPNLSGKIAPRMGPEPGPILEPPVSNAPKFEYTPLQPPLERPLSTPIAPAGPYIPPIEELPPLPRVGGGSPITMENVPEFPIKYRVKSMKSGEPVQLDDMFPEGMSREAGTSKRDLGVSPRQLDKLPDNIRKAVDETGAVEIKKQGNEYALYDAEGNELTKAIGEGKAADSPVVTPGMSLRERGISPRQIEALPSRIKEFVNKNREDLLAVKEDGDDFVVHMRKDGKDVQKRLSVVEKKAKTEKPPTEQVSDVGGVSPEELSRPGVFYKMGKSGEPTYLGKKVDAGNLKEGEAIIQVKNGEASIYGGSGSNDALERFKKSQTGAGSDKAYLGGQEVTVKRAGDFADSHNYDVTVKGETHKMYRDPENGWWYLESSSPLIADKHFSQRVLGFTKEEALGKLTKLVNKKKK
jgi:hypothetical protein